MNNVAASAGVCVRTRVAVRGWLRCAADGRYEIHVRDRGGALRTVGACQLKNRSGTTGYRLDIAVAHVAEIQLIQDNQVRLTATLPT